MCLQGIQIYLLIPPFYDLPGAGWYVDKVVVRDGDDPEGATFVFPSGRWFDVGQDDGEIERELLPGKEQGKLYICTTLIYFFFFNCMFYQLLRVQLHSCSFTQSWGSVLPSIVETRDQNSRGCPLLFSNRNLGSFCA